MIKAKLTGYSGCDIKLMHEPDKGLFVRKSATDETYNSRLEKQCIKQETFQHSYLLVPKVLDKGKNGKGLFYFDMEYIKGIALSEYVKTIETYRMRDFVGELVTNIISAKTVKLNDTNEIFREKLEKLTLQTLGCNSIIDETLQVLKDFDWSNFESAPCHGDLTMENIIVKGEDIYLIDFLDSFYDSPYIDLGKLLQDVIALWSYRNDPKITPNTLIRLKILKDLLVEIIGRSDKGLCNTYHALLLHLLRIIPYAKDKATLDFVTDKMALTLNLIKSI